MAQYGRVHHEDLEAQANFDSKDGFSYQFAQREVRMGFVRKVFGECQRAVPVLRSAWA